MREATTRRRNEALMWRTGTQRRWFLYSDDMPDACLHPISLPDRELESLVSARDPPLVNAGRSEDLSIAELPATVARVVGFRGALRFDSSKADGTPRKLLGVTSIGRLGWRARTRVEQRLEATYQDFLRLHARPG